MRMSTARHPSCASMNTSFLTRDELLAVGFRSVGCDVLVSRYAMIYGAEGMTLGDHVRIDDFCVLLGRLTIGSHVHVSAYVALYGACGIVIESHSGVSPRTTVFSEMDDFGGDWLIGPMKDMGTTHVTGGEVRLCRYSQQGAHCVVFPGVTVGEGTVTGAMTLVNRSLDAWGVYVGCPARRLRDRSRDLLRFVGL